MDLSTFLVVAVLATGTSALTNVNINTTSTILELRETSSTGIQLILTRNNKTQVLASLGRDAGAISASSNVVNGQVNLTFANSVNLTVHYQDVTGNRTGGLVTLSWKAPKTTVLRDCVPLGSHNWYGGPQQKHQYWPIEKLVLSNYSYVTKEADNCGVAERYWLNSDGVFYYLDSTVPLFVDQNVIEKNATCFLAQVAAPYSYSKRDNNTLSYQIGIFDNAKVAHQYVVDTYFKKPTGYPDENMITYPIWSTWARYKAAINESVVLKFADEITSKGFTNGQFELDDLWEICYGAQTVDVKRFPDMKNTTTILKSKGYRVTMWTHPFLNKGCEPWYTEAKNNGYLVISENDVVDSSWWNNNDTNTSYIDFTKTAARDWYIQRVKQVQSDTGVDSFKFDGGESSWSPQIPVFQGDITEQPNKITSDYVRAVANFGPLVEVRVGYKTQDLPIFVRMIDKDSNWDFENGLATLITTMFQMNMNGYPLVLPDMIGGNGYNGPPSKELFIRWLQANTFMPSMQFSFVPWDFDNETLTISKTFVDLHAKFAPNITAACKAAVANGSPVNPPIWWIAPNDTTALGIWDEYLLGENILVAPVVTANATTRNIYLPAGVWYKQGNTSNKISGPIWINDYSAPLNVLPYFIRQTVPDSGASLVASVLLVLLAGIFNVLYGY